MNAIIRYGFIISLISYEAIYLILFFIESQWMLHLLSISGLLALILALANFKPSNGLVPYFITMAALVLGFFTMGGEAWLQLWGGLRQMSSIIFLLFFVPMISWVLREEHYIEALVDSIRGLLKTSKRFYSGLMVITQIISYFLLFAAIPMVYQLVKVLLGNKKTDSWEYFKGTALLRGFGLSCMWVISIPSVVYIIDSTGASLGFSLVQGFGISVCAVLLSLLFVSIHEKKNGANFTKGIREELDKHISTEDIHHNKSIAIEFGLLFVTLFGPILIFNSFLDWGLLVIIPMCIVIWSSIYYITKQKWRVFVSHLHSYLRKDLVNKKQEIGILLAAGMLINIVNGSGWGLLIFDNLLELSSQYSFIHIFWLLPFFVIFLGFLGLGPLTVMVLVGGILESVTLPYPPELIVLSLTTGSAITVFLSPFILPNIVLSSANNISQWKNGLKFNLGYSIVFYLMIQAYLMIMLRIW